MPRNIARVRLFSSWPQRYFETFPLVSFLPGDEETCPRIFTGVFTAQQKMQEQTDTSTDSCALITIMNADGIYLATYAALLLNLKLIRINYYHEDNRQVPISEVSIDHSPFIFTFLFTFLSLFLSLLLGAIRRGGTRIWSFGIPFGDLVVRAVSTSFGL